MELIFPTSMEHVSLVLKVRPNTDFAELKGSEAKRANPQNLS